MNMCMIIMLTFCFHGLILLSRDRNLAPDPSIAVPILNPPIMAVNLNNGNLAITYSSNMGQIVINWYNSAAVLIKTYNLCNSGCYYPSIAQSIQGGTGIIYYDSIAGQITALSYDDSQTLKKTVEWSVTSTSTCSTSISNGSYVFCWVSTTGNISFVISDSTFTNFQSPVSFEASTNSKCSISGLSNGNFILAWNMNSQVYGKIYDSMGNVMVNSFVINNSLNANRSSPSVTGLSNGNFIVAWDSDETGTISVYAKLYGNNAVTITTTEFLVNFYSFNDNHHPIVAETIKGGFVVFWQNYVQGGWDIYFKEFDNTGNQSSSENIGNTIKLGDQTYPNVVTHPTQRYVIAYISTGTTIMLNLAGDVRTNPTCSDLSPIGRTWSEGNVINSPIDFSLSIKSPLMSVASLKIRLHSLPRDGYLKNRSTNDAVSINFNYAYNEIIYVPGKTYLTPFTFTVLDTLGQISDLCVSNLKTCYGTCASCYSLGDYNNQYCYECNKWHAKSNSDNCYHVGNLMSNECCASFIWCLWNPPLPMNCHASFCSDFTCKECNEGFYTDVWKNCLPTCPSGQYAEYNNYDCKWCEVRYCQTCNKNVCIACNQGFYYLAENNKCVETCPLNFFGDTSTSQCLKCPSFCTSCNNKSCMTCTANFFLHLDNLCYNNCPAGYYGDVTTGTCRSCSENCSSCSNNTVCLRCSDSYYLIPSYSSCTLICPSGFYPDATNKLCKACPQNCVLCSDEFTCMECVSGNFLNPLNNQCSSECPSKYFINILNNQCNLCPENCTTCSSNFECTTCSKNYFLNSHLDGLCYSFCSLGFYGDIETGTCTPCSENCNLCSNATACLKCSFNYLLVPETSNCSQSCPTGFSADTENGLCVVNPACPSNCDLCSDPNSCLQCSKGYFTDDLNQCQSCSLNCEICDNSQTCLRCSANYFQLELDSPCGDCPVGFYGDPSSQTCVPCPTNCADCTDTYCNTCAANYYKNDEGDCSQNCDLSCKTCLNGSSCMSCNPGFYLDRNAGNLCVDICSTGSYGNLSTHKCEPCIDKCKICTESTSCLNCADGFFLDITGICRMCDPTCTTCDDSTPCSCSIESYEDSEGNCYECHPSCSSCSDPNSCTSCAIGMYFDVNVDNLCHSSCSVGYFGNAITGDCEGCPHYCDSCDSRAKCLKCATYYYLHTSDYNCHSFCPLGFFNDDSSGTGLCTKCPNNCALCTNSSYCTNCNFGYHWNNESNTCSADCPPQFFYNIVENQCESCPSNCNYCENSDSCKYCSLGYCLNADDLQCYSTTLEPLYNDYITNRCQSCPPNCRKCFDGNSCKICYNNYYLDLIGDKLCHSTCPDDYFTNSKGSCLPCSSGCNKCSNYEQCDACKINYYFYKGFCYKICPTTMFGDIISRKCMDCPTSCSSCFNYHKCTRCKSGFYLNYTDNQCYLLCPNNCSSCSDNYTCTKCENGNYLNRTDNKCYPTCPKIGHYISKSDNTCNKCTENCTYCNGNYCIKCNTGYFSNIAYDKLCYETCPPTTYNNYNLMICSKCEGIFRNCNTCTAKFCTQCKYKYYVNAEGTCSPCPKGCLICSSDSICTTCFPTWFLMPLESTCHSKCPQGYFGDKTTKSCKPCKSNCKNCSDGASCA